jgi:hypothetical protein
LDPKVVNFAKSEARAKHPDRDQSEIRNNLEARNANVQNTFRILVIRYSDLFRISKFEFGISEDADFSPIFKSNGSSEIIEYQTAV